MSYRPTWPTPEELHVEWTAYYIENGFALAVAEQLGRWKTSDCFSEASDWEKDHGDYIEEMSIGGRIYEEKP